MKKCTNGHDIEDDQETCADGHPAADASAPNVVTIGQEQLQDIIKNAAIAVDLICQPTD